MIFLSMAFASVGTGLGPLLAQPERVDISSLFPGRALFALAVLAVPPMARRHLQEHAVRGRLRIDQP